MTRIDFYVMEQANPPQFLQFICRLTEKAWRQGHDIFIHCENRDAAVRLDDMLWTFRDTSFLPHGLIADNVDVPVKLGYASETPPVSDLLINLAQQVPAFFSRFERVVETTGANEHERKLARDRYRYYQQRGYALETHTISAAA